MSDDFRIVNCDCDVPEFGSAEEEHAWFSRCDGCDGSTRIIVTVSPVTLDDLEEIAQPCPHSTPALAP